MEHASLGLEARISSLCDFICKMSKAMGEGRQPPGGEVFVVWLLGAEGVVGAVART
jgi:hypothetical protein